MTALRPTEDQCEDTIIDAAKLAGWRVHVERRSRTKDGWATAIKGHKGWPDMTLAHPDGRLIVVELKRKPNKPTPDQEAWLSTLRACGVDARIVWVPEELDALLSEITGVSR